MPLGSVDGQRENVCCPRNDAARSSQRGSSATDSDLRHVPSVSANRTSEEPQCGIDRYFRLPVSARTKTSFVLSSIDDLDHKIGDTNCHLKFGSCNRSYVFFNFSVKITIPNFRFDRSFRILSARQSLSILLRTIYVYKAITKRTTISSAKHWNFSMPFVARRQVYSAYWAITSTKTTLNWSIKLWIRWLNIVKVHAETIRMLLSIMNRMASISSLPLYSMI